MKGKCYTEEQIVGFLKAHEPSMPAQDVIHKHGIVNDTFYRWKSKCGGMEVSEAKRFHAPAVPYIRRNLEELIRGRR